MKYIGIIAAEDKEVLAIKNIMTDLTESKIYNITVYIGKIKEKQCVLAQSGVGKVNAARTAQILIDKFNVSHIINTGSAGALDEKLKIGDVVISEGLVQYDFDVTAFGREKGFISGVGKIFEADNDLVSLVENIVLKKNIRYYKGIIATGDRFLSSKEVKADIGKEFGALCGEMEGAAVAHVCKLCAIPFVVIRSVSDELNGEAKIEFDKFLDVASKRCAEIIYSII